MSPREDEGGDERATDPDGVHASSSEIAERQLAYAAVAAGDLSEIVYVVMQEAMRQGVDLPEGFVGRVAAAVGARALVPLRKFGARCYRDGVERGALVAEVEGAKKAGEEAL